MANEAIDFLNWYRRYRVTAQDMTDFGQSHADTAHGLAEAIGGPSVIRGLNIGAGDAVNVAVDPGLAIGPSGNLLVHAESVLIQLEAPDSDPRRDLIVIRPKLTNTDYITSPTAPFLQVPLKTTQGSEVVAIAGTPGANPAYPDKLENDVIIAGVIVLPSVSSLSNEDIDHSIKEVPGIGEINGFPSFTAKHVLHADDRLRPYRASALTMGIKPSQTGAGQTSLRTFFYPGRSTPSIYPKNSGNFSNSDAILNFSTGDVDGGDATSANFTPTVPTGNNCIVATVILKATDEVEVVYGTEGTRIQCYEAITNQRSNGAAGAINNGSRSSYKLAYVVIQSRTGSIQDIEVIDIRAIGGASSDPTWDAIVGTSPGCTHVTLQEAIDSVSAGARILIRDSATISTAVDVDKQNVLIEGAPGVTYTKGGSATECFEINADGVRVRGMRFDGFPNAAIVIPSGALYCFITECRVVNMGTTDYLEEDSNPNNVIVNNIVE